MKLKFYKMEDSKQAFSDMVRVGLMEFRKSKGLTQREVADKMGIHVTTYSKWEKGASHTTRTPNLHTLSRAGVAIGFRLIVENGKVVFENPAVLNENPVGADSLVDSLFNYRITSREFRAAVKSLSIDEIKTNLSELSKFVEIAEREGGASMLSFCKEVEGILMENLPD